MFVTCTSSVVRRFLCLPEEAIFNENMSILKILPFCLFSNVLSSTVSACLAHANSFL